MVANRTVCYSADLKCGEYPALFRCVQGNHKGLKKVEEGATKGKRVECSQSFREAMQPSQHLNFSPVRSVLDF